MAGSAVPRAWWRSGKAAFAGLLSSMPTAGLKLSDVASLLKYRNRKVVKPEGAFDSAGEYERWLVLKQMQKDGEIYDLERQVKLQLECGGIPIIYSNHDGRKTRAATLVVDFFYRFPNRAAPCYEDFKGFETRVSRLKRAIFEAETGQRILVTTKGCRKASRKPHRGRMIPLRS